MATDPLTSTKFPSGVHLGTMNFGKRTSESEARAVIARALALGVRVFDTANAYTDGNSERIVGEALRRVRDDVVIATKVGFGRSGGKPEGLAPERIRAACDESLGRLGTDRIDVYYLHVPDHQTPIASTLDAMAELLDKKKILDWGVSNYAAWQVLEMIPLAEARGMPRPLVAQQLYNVLIRQLDVEWMAFATKYALHTTVYNPLAGGLLTGKHSKDGSTQKGSRFDNNRLYQGRYWSDEMFARVAQLEGIAKTADMSLVELAYSWVAGAPGVSSVLLGPANVTQLDEGVKACAREMAPETRLVIDALHKKWLGTETYYVR